MTEHPSAYGLPFSGTDREFMRFLELRKPQPEQPRKWWKWGRK